MRTFKGNAVRDTNEGKISYYGFRHPLIEHSFGKYMLFHQKQADGNMREANNWWSGWSEDVSIDSLVRHVEDLQAIHAGLHVYKVRGFNGERTVVSIKPIKDLEGFGAEINKEDCYNAVRFNSGAGLLEHLKNYDNNIDSLTKHIRNNSKLKGNKNSSCGKCLGTNT